jgi:thiol:disulfide interchange protein DsbC
MSLISLKRFLGAALLAICAAHAVAAGSPASDSDANAAAFMQRVNAHFPATVGAKIEPAFPGFWSIVKGQEVLFIRDDLSVMVTGDVIDLGKNASMVAALRAANRPHVATKQLDLHDAIQMGSGSRRLYVFSDPDCPYCRQLEPELAKLRDVQVYVFPFPLDSIHPNARTIAESIWCQKDKATAWHSYLMTGVAPKPATCDNPISRNLAAANRYQIFGTPAIVFEDGTVVPGAITAERIEAQLNAPKLAQAPK